MPKKELIKTSYQALVTNISDTYEKASSVVVEAHWKIGQLIIEEEQKHLIRAAYGTRLLERLSDDLTKRYGSGFSYENLAKMRKFYIQFPILSAQTELQWTHYKLLSQVKNDATRRKLERRAMRENLSSRALGKIVQSEMNKTRKNENRPPRTLSVHCGQIYQYPISEIKQIHKKRKHIIIDCGFHIFHTMRSSRVMRKGESVRVVKNNDRYTLRPVKLKKKALFTYKAYLERVVDGDTLWVYVDVGFGSWTRQKLRLRGIDTPEISEKAGKDAKSIVQKALRKSPFLFIQTHKSDKYDRYLADIFYLRNMKAREEDILKNGIFLNQDLLDMGIARYRDK